MSNSFYNFLGWVQSPGALALTNPSEYPRLEAYVKDVVGAFANDDRVLYWDLWNEPNGNGSVGDYGGEDPANKWELVLNLLPQIFQWARSVKPKQPLTICFQQGEYVDDGWLDEMNEVIVNNSDIITFHQ